MVNEVFPGFVLVLCVCGVCVYMCVGGALTSVGVDGGLRLTVGCLPSHSSALVLNFLTVILARVASQHPARSVCICPPQCWVYRCVLQGSDQTWVFLSGDQCFTT